MFIDERRSCKVHIPHTAIGMLIVCACVFVFLATVQSFESRPNSEATELAPEVKTLLDKAEEAIKDGSKGAMKPAQERALQLVEEALVQAQKLPDERARKVARMHALAAKPNYLPYSMEWKENNIKLYEETMALARELEDKAMQAKLLIRTALLNDSIEKCEEAAELYRSIENQAGEGEARQWLGSLLLRKGIYAEAKLSFTQAKTLLNQSKEYQWATACDAALEFIAHVPQPRAADSMEAYSWGCEMLQVEENELISYLGQSGGISGGGRLGAHPFWEIGVMNDLVMNSKHPGDTIVKETRSYGVYPLSTTGTVVSDNETVTVPAGTFTKCRLIRMETQDTEETKAEDEMVVMMNQFMLGVREVWYAPGVGMVKLRVDKGEGSYTCVLKEYSVQQNTQDYLPLAIGNRWVYGREDLDAQAFMSENGLQVCYRDEKDIYYLSHCSFTMLTKTEITQPLSSRVESAPPPMPEQKDEPTAHALYDKMVETMRKAETLSYKSEYRWGTKERENGRCTYTIWMKKPNYFHVETVSRGQKGGTLIGDGDYLWIYWPGKRPYFSTEDFDTYKKTSENVYMEKPTPIGRHSIAHEVGLLGAGMSMTIIDPSTFHGYTDSLQPYIDWIRSIGTEQVEDEECDGIEVSIMNHQRSWYLWLSKKDHLPRKLKEVVRVSYDIITEELWSEVTIDAEIPMDKFVWAPPKDWQEWRMPGLEEMLLKPGQEAPDFDLLSMDGGRIKLSDYRGKSAVWLYIWRAG
jgi:outer membrane lipoprotein-sorting protein